jgi:hypothetical protein
VDSTKSTDALSGSFSIYFDEVNPKIPKIPKIYVF